MAVTTASSQKSVSPQGQTPRATEKSPIAQLAEVVAQAQARLNHPKAEKTSIRREPVDLLPTFQPAESALSRTLSKAEGSEVEGPLSQAAVNPSGTGSQPVRVHPTRSFNRFGSRSMGHEPQSPRISSVAQAKNYLRAGKIPKRQQLGPAPNLAHHRRKCAICRHPEREMIEELFIHWHSPQAIANFLSDYDEINWVAIYRHAYALGLDEIRRRNLRYFFENILDDAVEATPTYAGILAAARALGCVTEDGRWVEPEKRILMTTVIRHEDPQATTSTDPDSATTTPLSQAAFDSCGTGSQPACAHPARSANRIGSRATRHEPAEESACPSSSILPEAVLDHPARRAESFARATGRGQTKESARVSSSSLPKAAVDTPAAAPQTPSSGQPSAARKDESIAASVSTLPEASFDNPASAKRMPSPGSPSASRSAHSEIRRDHNSLKTNEKSISNR